MANLFLEKGSAISFLDYTIKNCTNSDGLVLQKDKDRPQERYECHLGNFGTGTEENVNTCKRYAIVHFMIARPDIFAGIIINKVMRKNSGCMYEFYAFRNACKAEGFDMPVEITAGDGINQMIYFKGKPLAL